MALHVARLGFLTHGSPNIAGLFNLGVGFLQNMCSMIPRWNLQGFLCDSLGHQVSPLLHSVGHRWGTVPAQVQGKRTTQGVNTRSAVHCGPTLETSYYSADKRWGPLRLDTLSLGVCVNGHFYKKRSFFFFFPTTINYTYTLTLLFKDGNIKCVRIVWRESIKFIHPGKM